MLKKLCEAFGPSGCEDEVRDKIRALLPQDCAFSIDPLGNAYAMKDGAVENSKTVMLCAHMDEVGFIISRIHSDGTLAFQSVGGVSPSCLLGKRLRVGEKKLLGVIGSTSVHLLSKEEKEQELPISQLYIDVGASSAEEAEMLVSLGDYAVFDTAFSESDGVLRGKALDDRLGCAVVIEALRSYTPQHYRLVGCFSVQEETGIRGGKVAARTIHPDIALVLETTTCNDLPNVLPQQRVTELGGGIALSVADAYTLYPYRFQEALCQLADKNGILLQTKNRTSGGNDCGSISIENGGVPIAVLSIPCRYLHTPISFATRSDYQACVDLVLAFLKEMESESWNF